MGFHDSLVPLVVCAEWASKVPTQEKVYNKYSAIVLWPKGQCVCVCVGGWRGGGGGGVQRLSGMTGISAISLI